MFARLGQHGAMSFFHSGDNARIRTLLRIAIPGPSTSVLARRYRKFQAPRSKMCTPMLSSSVGPRPSSWMTPKSVIW